MLNGLLSGQFCLNLALLFQPSFEIARLLYGLNVVSQVLNALLKLAALLFQATLNGTVVGLGAQRHTQPLAGAHFGQFDISA